MSEEKSRYVRVESFTDEVLIQIASLPAPLTTCCVLLALAVAFAFGLWL